jgi:hypothetical protein
VGGQGEQQRGYKEGEQAPDHRGILMGECGTGPARPGPGTRKMLTETPPGG